MTHNKHIPLNELLDLEYPHLVDVHQELAEMQRRYTDFKQTKSLIDYDDLLIKLRDLLADHADVRNRLSDNYRYIMVDEYQDTNHLQSEIIRLLARPMTMSRWSVTTRRASILFAAPIFATSWTFPNSLPARA
jgi:superfamily I DNA/RNA helicase